MTRRNCFYDKKADKRDLEEDIKLLQKIGFCKVNKRQLCEMEQLCYAKGLRVNAFYYGTTLYLYLIK